MDFLFDASSIEKVRGTNRKHHNDRTADLCDVMLLRVNTCRHFRSDSVLLKTPLGDLGFRFPGTARPGMFRFYLEQEMRADDLHTSPTMYTRMLNSGDAPVLVQSQYAGNQTTKVGDSGAAAPYVVSKVFA